MMPRGSVPVVGANASHRFRDLDPREVVEVSPDGTQVKIDLLTTPSDWLPADQYEYSYPPGLLGPEVGRIAYTVGPFPTKRFVEEVSQDGTKVRLVESHLVWLPEGDWVDVADQGLSFAIAPEVLDVDDEDREEPLDYSEVYEGVTQALAALGVVTTVAIDEAVEAIENVVRREGDIALRLASKPTTSLANDAREPRDG